MSQRTNNQEPDTEPAHLHGSVRSCPPPFVPVGAPWKEGAGDAVLRASQRVKERTQLRLEKAELSTKASRCRQLISIRAEVCAYLRAQCVVLHPLIAQRHPGVVQRHLDAQRRLQEALASFAYLRGSLWKLQQATEQFFSVDEPALYLCLGVAVDQDQMEGVRQDFARVSGCQLRENLDSPLAPFPAGKSEPPPAPLIPED